MEKLLILLKHSMSDGKQELFISFLSNSRTRTIELEMQAFRCSAHRAIAIQSAATSLVVSDVVMNAQAELDRIFGNSVCHVNTVIDKLYYMAGEVLAGRYEHSLICDLNIGS